MAAAEPGYRDPMLATLGDGPVGGDGWVFERKLDGIRLLAVRDGDIVQLFTRNKIDRADRYPEIRDALLAQPNTRFVADGEVVAFDGETTSFGLLQGRAGVSGSAAAARSGIAIYYYVFDLMHLNGLDCDSLPLRDRKELLRQAFEFRDPLRDSVDRTGDGAAYLREACAAGWEGLIAKRIDAPYTFGRSRDWLKLKCVKQQEFVIGGFSAPKGTRGRFGALLVGYYDDAQELRYAGRVGTGFREDVLARLGDALDARATTESPFVDAPRARDVTWVEPDLVCEVGFTEWTGGGMLRHPRFLGLRDDKAAREVRREVPESG